MKQLKLSRSLFRGSYLKTILLLIFCCPTFAAGAGTSFLNPDRFLAGFAEADWYKENIPFLEVPDPAIQKIYYYRWSSFKRHIHYTNPAHGFIITEFAHVPGYSGAFGAINAAAGHHIYEGRWLKNQRYLDDYEIFWMRGAGRNPTAGYDTGGLNSAHQYSFWAADAAYNRFLVHGRRDFVQSLLPDLVRQYEEWNPNFDSARGLYWQFPVWDAMEFTISSYQSNDPYHGGAGFRPSLNAYQWADARAVSAIARLAGKDDLAADFESRARALKSNMQAQLWDPKREFFYHMMHRNAEQGYPQPEGSLLDGREIIGFFPWAFHMPDPQYAVAWKQLMDPQGFYALYGPTTAERRHRLFLHEAEAGCCRWNGVSWPFATSLTLMGLANLLNDQAQTYVSKDDYFKLLRNYALTHSKQGRPYIAEAHHPDEDRWIYDGTNHSEHYNHSTFNDLVISGLIGIRPRADNRFVLNPLVPSNWNYFLLENVPYHGQLITVLWDRDGTRYGQGPGLRIYQNGDEIASVASLGRMEVELRMTPRQAEPIRLDNIAANPSRRGFPSPIASFTGAQDNPWEPLDGDIWYDDIPDSRWTAYGSPHASDWYGVDFGSPRLVDEIQLYFYDDGGGVKAPLDYTVQYWNGQAWLDAESQVKTPSVPRGPDRNLVRFSPVYGSQFRVVFTHQGASRTGLTEFEVWNTGGSGPAYQLIHRTSGKCLDLAGGSAADGAKIQLWTCTGGSNQQWRLDPLPHGNYRLVHIQSGKVLDAAAGLNRDGAAVRQWSWKGTKNQQLHFSPSNEGWLRIAFAESGKLLDVQGCADADGSSIHQWTWTGSDCQQWRLQPVGFNKIVNVHSAKVLDVDGVSSADGANIHQWTYLNSPNQHWAFTPNDNGWYSIQARHSGKIVDSAGVQDQGEGVNVQQWSPERSLDQQWRIEPLADGTFRIVVRHSGKVLDLSGCGTKDGTNVQLWTWLDNTCQRFRIERP